MSNTSQTLVATVAGNYTVDVTYPTGCIATSNTITVYNATLQSPFPIAPPDMATPIETPIEDDDDQPIYFNSTTSGIYFVEPEDMYQRVYLLRLKRTKLKKNGKELDPKFFDQNEYKNCAKTRGIYSI